MKLKLKRNNISGDGIFGILTIENSTFSAFSCENLAKSIMPGTYAVVIDHSPRLGFDTPHIIVPLRDNAAGGDAGIRIHPANFPHELDGCIAVGDTYKDNSVLNSRKTFAKLMDILKKEKDITIEIS